MSLASQISALASRIATEFKAVRAAFPTADTLSGATTTGKAVIKASSTTAARTAIGAGTSSLALGTTSTTAKAGNYQPTAANISDATTVGQNVLKAVDATAARVAIGAGTSSLVLGTTSGTAADAAATQAMFDGVRGSKWWYGVGPPDTVPGSIAQDMYLDTSNGDVWEL